MSCCTRYCLIIFVKVIPFSVLDTTERHNLYKPSSPFALFDRRNKICSGKPNWDSLTTAREITNLGCLKCKHAPRGETSIIYLLTVNGTQAWRWCLHKGPRHAGALSRGDTPLFAAHAVRHIFLVLQLTKRSFSSSRVLSCLWLFILICFKFCTILSLFQSNQAD